MLVRGALAFERYRRVHFRSPPLLRKYRLRTLSYACLHWIRQIPDVARLCTAGCSFGALRYIREIPAKIARQGIVVEWLYCEQNRPKYFLGLPSNATLVFASLADPYYLFSRRILESSATVSHLK